MGNRVQSHAETKGATFPTAVQFFVDYTRLGRTRGSSEWVGPSGAMGGRGKEIHRVELYYQHFAAEVR
jgi:hypothetical protein